MRKRLDNLLRAVAAGSAAWALVNLTLAVVLAQTPSTYAEWVGKRVEVLEAQNFDGRLRVLESDMGEVKYLTRTITTVMIGQFAFIGITVLRKARKSEEEAA